VAGIGGEAAHAFRRIVEPGQQVVEGIGQRAQFQRQRAGIQRGEVRHGAGVALRHRHAQPRQRAQAPAKGRAHQQRRQPQQHQFAQQQRAGQLADQCPAVLQRFGYLHHHGLRDPRQVALHLRDADVLPAIGGEAEVGLLPRQAVQRGCGQIGIASQQFGSHRQPVIDIVAFGVLQHAEGGGRELQRHAAVLHPHLFRDGAQRSAQHAIIGAAHHIVHQRRPGRAQPDRRHQQRQQDRRQQAGPEGDRRRPATPGGCGINRH